MLLICGSSFLLSLKPLSKFIIPLSAGWSESSLTTSSILSLSFSTASSLVVTLTSLPLTETFTTVFVVTSTSVFDSPPFLLDFCCSVSSSEVDSSPVL